MRTKIPLTVRCFNLTSKPPNDSPPYGCLAGLGTCAPLKADPTGESMKDCPKFHNPHVKKAKPISIPALKRREGTSPAKAAAKFDRKRAEATCTLLGPPTGEVKDCILCGPDKKIPLLVCNGPHKVCTKEKRLVYKENGQNVEVAWCMLCKDKITAEDAAGVNGYQLIIDADGVGDHLIAATIGTKWKQEHPGEKLHAYARSQQWLNLFEGAFDSVSLVPIAGAVPVYHELNLARRGATHFVQAASTVPGRVAPKMLPLHAEALKWAEQFRGSVILAPLSLGSGAGRNWLISHWQSLERSLTERGIPCIVIGSGCDKVRLGALRSQVIAGMPAANVAALMKVARCVVSNESGMGHLAGAVGVPAIVLAAHFEAAPLYEIWPTVRVLQGPLSCGGCGWTGPNYRPDICADHCANLQSIMPEIVLAALEPFIGKPDEPFLADADRDRELQGHLAKLVVPNPSPSLCPLTLADRRPTAKLFLRELAKVKDPLIVETGCQRIDLDYGAGMSTTIFGLFLKGHGGKLISLDHESTYATFAKARTTDAGLPVEVIHTDSIFWLKNYAGPKFNAFYFDSQDTWVPGFQEHCLLEVQTAIWHFADDAIIMIDDTWRLADAWGGKGAKAVPWLISQGWKVLLDGWQVILRRDG